MKQLPWQWAAQGKHPLVKDYIQLGRGFPLMSVFADWVRNGYGLVSLTEGERGGEGETEYAERELPNQFRPNCRGGPLWPPAHGGKGRHRGLPLHTGCVFNARCTKRGGEGERENHGDASRFDAPTLPRSHAPTLQRLSHLRSFRFWTRGAGKDALVCGLVKDSSDRIGRPYPFLIMGTGTLPGWEEHWDLIPPACERIWREMEHHAVSVSKQPAQVADIQHLEDTIMTIKPPLSQWSELSQERDSSCQGGSWESTEMAGKTLDLLKEEVVIDLGQGQGHDHDYLILVSFWHRFLKDHYAGMLKGYMPKAVFMGGTVDKISLVVFQRPLRPADFVLLWSF
jgi:hypothetical protein